LARLWKNVNEINVDGIFARDRQDGLMVFGEKTTPARKAEIERIGRELEKRAKK